MDNKPFTRNEIASRSRKRQQIKKEEAEKLGVIQKGIWLNKDQIEELTAAGVTAIDEAINEGLALLLKNKGFKQYLGLPMDEIEENAFVRAKQAGL